MKIFATLSALAVVGHVSAFWRMPCRGTTGLARLDPLVDPGSVSNHVHTITGSGGFSNNATYESLTAPGSCTACGVTQDKSAYWTPTLYFQYPNGSTVLVPQVGGMLAYYLYYLDNVKAFPEGFAMIGGNPTYRNFTGPFPDEPLSSWPTDPTDQFFLEQRALGFNCLNYAADPEPSLYRHQFPDKAYMDAHCADGLRLELAFPSCGKEGALDSEDHRSHVKYPSLVKEGNCPEEYDVHYPFLFFETIWATNQFIGIDGRFLLSTGDSIGSSYHADFIMGWESADFLQNALDTCKSQSGDIADCPLFTLQSDEEAAQCSFAVPDELADDNCHGAPDGLPAGVPVQEGPEPATKYIAPGQHGKAPPPSKPTKPPAYAVPTPAYSSASSTSSSPSSSTSSSTSTSAAPSSPVHHHHAGAKGSSAPHVTPAPAPTPTPLSKPDCFTSYITKGNEVIELVVEEIAVTVTATATATATGHPAPPGYGPDRKRHIHNHAHNQNF